MVVPNRRRRGSRMEHLKGEHLHSEEATRDVTPAHHQRMLEGLLNAPWDFVKGTMEQVSHIVPHHSHQKDGSPTTERSDGTHHFALPCVVGNALTDVTHTVGACVDACLPPILLNPRHLWLQYPKPHVEATKNAVHTSNVTFASEKENSFIENEMKTEIEESHMSYRTSRPSFVSTSLPPRLVNSFRVQSMHESSEWNKSYFPIFRLIWQLLQQWYYQVERLVRPMPLILWPFLLLLTFFFPMLPLVVLPLATLVYHYGAQLYRNFTIPTPERVLELINWIYHIVTGWWTRFVGRARLDPEDDDDVSREIRIRKRTALAVSLATHAAGIGGNKRK